VSDNDNFCIVSWKIVIKENREKTKPNLFFKISLLNPQPLTNEKKNKSRFFSGFYIGFILPLKKRPHRF